MTSAEFVTEQNKIVLRKQEDSSWLIEIYLISHSMQEMEKRINVGTYDTAYLYVYENYIKKRAVG